MHLPRLFPFLVASGLFAAPPCQLPALKGERVFPGAEGGRFCTAQRLSVREASYQILVDDSGSMRGMLSQMPVLIAWVEQALSQVRRFDMNWSRSRSCAFSSSRPLAGCSGAQLSPGGLKGAGDTTLDEAISSARDFDLSVLLTDGAGAGGPATRECANGVDAACVGRALAAALQPRAGERAGVRGGVWLLPLLVHHNGPFFTEQLADPSSVDPAAIREAVTSDTRVAVEVSGLRRGASGTLSYQYSGPRVMLLIVIARQTDVGRAFVAALQARREYAQLSAIANFGEYRGGVAVMPAVEVYPGAASGLQWNALRVSQPTCLTLDARLRKDGRLSIGCSNPQDEAVLTLTASAPPDSFDCARLLMLPILRTELRQDRTLRAVRDYAWRGSAQDPARPVQLQLRLGCSAQWRSRLSGACHSAAQVVSRRDTAATIESLVSRKTTSPALSLIHRISSSSVIYAPHKAFQLVETLERFYRTVQPLDASSQEVILGTIDLCWIQ